MKLNGVMKALVWLGLGGGIGFFAGYRVGYSKDKKDIIAGCNQALDDTRTQERKFWGRQLDLKDAEIRDIKEQAREALKAQREYFGTKDDEVISELHYVDNIAEDADETVMEETPEMPDDPFPEEDDGDNDEDEEIPQLHPEDLRPFAISASEYLQNDKGYDQFELDYYTEDCVIFDPKREEVWTHPEQLLGIGWKERFISTDESRPIREIYVCNDTMEILYKITRIDDSFERLYEEE